MKNLKNFTLIQILIWTILFMFMFVHTFQRYSDPSISFFNAFIGTTFYAIGIYLHSRVLIPSFYEKGKIALHITVALVSILLLVLTRMTVEYEVLYKIFDRPFYVFDRLHFFFNFYTITLSFIVGILLRATHNYIHLLKDQEELKSRQLQTEINLLKSQVQPHFLFNTLNNIYFLSLTKSDKTSETIARLSDIMRYFVDQAPKDKVPLAIEVAFLRNYIELEQIRMRYPVKIKFESNENIEQIEVPPMLLVPFVENIFKHGIDKTEVNNNAELKLQVQNSTLTFTTINSTFDTKQSETPGTGLENLERRLKLLFDKNYRISVGQQEGFYKAELQIPVA